MPLAAAVPLVALELWFDMRSRTRRLLPELAGSVGIGSIVAAIVLADGGDAPLAVGLWIVIAARAVAAIPFVRLQLSRAKRQPHRVLTSDAAQATTVAIGVAALAVDGHLLAGDAYAVALVAVVHTVLARRGVQPAAPASTRRAPTPSSPGVTGPRR